MIFLGDHGATRGREPMPVSFKGAHFPQEIILTCVRWYVAYPLSTCHIEELMQERGVSVDHATVNRWVLKYSPPLEEAFHRRKRTVGRSWRMTKHTFASKDSGAVSIAPSIGPGRPLTFCSRSSGIQKPRSAFSHKRSAATVSPRRSPLMVVRPMPRRSSATTKHMAPPSS